MALVNLITFLFGVYVVYKLGRWLTGETAATFGAALFASQPLLWGHAFINPKDMPFMVLFAAAVWTGVHAVDRLLGIGTASRGRILRELLLPAIFLVLPFPTVLGPLARRIVGLYWIARQPITRTLAWLVAYGILGTVMMYATWPYLWEDSLHFFEVFGLMAQNPTVLQVLFQETVYRANELPLRYLLSGRDGLQHSGWRQGPPTDRLLRSWVSCAPLAYVMLAPRPCMMDAAFLFVLPGLRVSRRRQSLLRMVRAVGAGASARPDTPGLRRHPAASVHLLQ
jgi:4-amino-4-deoxy-L-arabinose transferase-like glycosyltransferase